MGSEDHCLCFYMYIVFECSVKFFSTYVSGIDNYLQHV